MSVTANSPAEFRTVLLAAPRSFCAGVERAIAVVEQLLDQRGGPIYVRKQIVHNIHVVADLEALGAVFVEELAAVPGGSTVVFSPMACLLRCGLRPSIEGWRSSTRRARW
jgi:hypothetical protein